MLMQYTTVFWNRGPLSLQWLVQSCDPSTCKMGFVPLITDVYADRHRSLNTVHCCIVYCTAVRAMYSSPRTAHAWNRTERVLSSHVLPQASETWRRFRRSPMPEQAACQEGRSVECCHWKCSGTGLVNNGEAGWTPLGMADKLGIQMHCCPPSISRACRSVEASYPLCTGCREDLQAGMTQYASDPHPLLW